MEQTIGDFLLRRLEEAGLRHIFGVAGDFNLALLEQLERAAHINWVGCCNELNAAYSADGYARSRGLGAVITTYGVGELSALCGVAGAYAEHVPVIFMVGAPPLSAIRRGALLHHTAGDGDYNNMMTCGQQFSIAQARITPQNAVVEIDRCLRSCIVGRRPVYLQIPSDVPYLCIRTPAGPIDLAIQSDSLMLDQCGQEVLRKLQSATNPAILVDADVARFGLSEKVRLLAYELNCPIASMGTAKGVIDEQDPHFVGIYTGAFSAPSVRQAVEDADCLLRLGVRLIDSTTGSFSVHLDPSVCVDIDAWSARVNSTEFAGITMSDLLDRLIAGVRRMPECEVASPLVEKTTLSAADNAITQNWFWQRMARFLEPWDVIAAENGTSLSGVATIKLPSGCSVISQALWGAIGYSLPATLGSLLAAPHRRHVLFIGDGSFQLTAQELSTILRHGLKPVIFLLNNDGYTIERLILGSHSSYNDIQRWRYSRLCAVFEPDGKFYSRRVTSEADLELALEDTAKSDCCCFLEVMMERLDAPAALRKLGPVYAQQDYGRGWMSRFDSKLSP